MAGSLFPKLNCFCSINNFSLRGILASQHAGIKTSAQQLAVITLTRLRVVDNSALGAAAAAINKPPRCIHVYNKKRVGRLGDKVMVTIKGEKKKALIVGVKRPGRNMTPRFDTNNIVLLEDDGNPTGTRISVPLPSELRQRKDFSKVLALATQFY